MIRIQLNVTKSRESDTPVVSVRPPPPLPLAHLSVFGRRPGRREQRFWDGQKAVYVVLLGSTVALPCINRRKVWTDWSDEEDDQQV